MKKFLGIILAVALCITGCFALTACSEGDDVLYVYTNSGFAPFEYVNDKGEVVGLDIDIAEEIGEILGKKVVVKDVEFGMIFTNVQNDPNAIAIAGITKNAEREEWGIFSDDYFTSTQYAVVKADSALAQKSEITITDLAGLKIGVQTATTGDFMISDAVYGTEDEETGEHITGDLEDGVTSVVGYKQILVASGSLGTQIDVMVIDELPAKSIADGTDGEYVAIPMHADPESFGIFLNKDATELKAKIDVIIAALKDSGTMDYFLLKHSGAIA